MLLLVVCTQSLGDTCLSIGMKHLGPVSLSNLPTLISAIFTPWILAGITLLICFFASYLSALSWADLTYVLPATAIGNVFMALLGRFLLHEPISVSRWIGIVLITAGVGFVAQGPSYTEPEVAVTPKEDKVPTEEGVL